MGMKLEDSVAQFSYTIQELDKRFPKLAYLHLVEPRVHGYDDISIPEGETNDHYRKLWTRLLVTTGGYDRSSAIETTEKNPRELIAMSRFFLANVSLPTHCF